MRTGTQRIHAKEDKDAWSAVLVHPLKQVTDLFVQVSDGQAQHDAQHEG